MDMSGLTGEIIEKLSDPVAILDRDGNVLAANSYFRKLYNPSNDPNRKKPCAELIKLNSHVHTSSDATASEWMVLGPLQQKLDVSLYSLESFIPGCNLSLCLVKVGEAEFETGELAWSHEVTQSFARAWKVFSDDLSSEFDEIQGEDVTLRLALQSAQKAAKTDLPILIRGESGTGKELLGRAIHRLSPRSKGPFVDLNCAAIPESLIESELFGYEKGAFTGASREGKKGLFDQANGGTIFLDEIGDASLPVQSKLLRVLQNSQFIRVGGTTNVTVDVRIISATNKELDSLVREKRFRDDLYYRLNTITITMPPLSKRGSDVRLLADFFLSEHSQRTGKTYSFSEEVLRIFESFPWPGNVRELKSMVEYAATMTEQPEIGPESLPFSMFLERPDPDRDRPFSGSFHPDLTGNRFLPGVIEDVEKTLIEKAIKLSRNRSDAIRMLGISRRTFYKKIKQYHLDDSRLS